MVEKISVQIALDGSEDIRKRLEALGTAGEKAFKQIQDAAKKPISDPAQIDRTKQAMNDLATAAAKLGPQFQQLATAAQQFGDKGAQATQQVTDGLNQTGAAAQQTGAAMRSAGDNAGTGLFSAATKFKIAAVGIVAAITAVTNALTKGAVETGTAIAAQAEKIGLTIPQWLELRKAIGATTLSQEDFLSSAGKIAKLMEQTKGGIARVSATVSEQRVQTDSGEIVIRRFNDTLTKTSSDAAKAAVALSKFGVGAQAMTSGDVGAGLRQAAEAINKIPDAAKRAAAGIAVFGKNWQQIVDILTKAQSLDPLKASRDLSAADIDKTVKLKAAWDDFNAAIRATRDQIGTLFLDPALARAEWLTKIVDGSRELFKVWAGLSDQKRETFLAGLGDSPAENLFKVLIAVGIQLGGIWRDVLVPAGSKLLAIFGGISDSIEGITKSQVAAFFITATIAAAGLAVALKAIGLALTPFSLLLSLFSGFGPILIALGALVVVFWDQFSAAATAALELIPNSLRGFQQAFAALFAGDFTSFWWLFSASATVAFQTIKQAILQSEGVLGDFLRALTGAGPVQIPWVQTLVDGLAQIGKDLPGTLLLIVNGLIALGNAATTAANAINKIFGTQLTGTDIAVIALLLQLTGGLTALAAIAGVTAAALSALVSVFSLLGTGIGLAVTGIGAAVTAFGLLPVLIGVAIVALVSFGAALIAINWDFFRAAGVAAWNAITGAIQGAIDAVLRFLGLKAQAGGTPLAGGAPIGQGGIGSNARGGLLGGRGSGTSDSNLAWVSRGEHIMPARAVAQPGVLALLEALRRSGGNLSRVLDGMGRFALGGMVPRAMPAFASGGLAAGGHLGTLTLGLPSGSSVNVRASASVVDQLRQEAALAQVRSGGRKPSRYS